MFKNSSVKKIYKKFNNFTKEEQWLQNMLQDGWILKSYDSEDIDEECKYIFEAVRNDEQKNGTYKIDYRSFSNAEDFEDYNNLFEDAGWTILAKNKSYKKHIFYTNTLSANHTIFSDTASYIGREKRKMNEAIQHIVIAISLLSIAIVLYTIYDKTSIIGGASVVFSLYGIPSIVAYYKHRKAYKSLIAQQN
jgi:Protein of unknown function (DUF2812)